MREVLDGWRLLAVSAAERAGFSYTLNLLGFAGGEAVSLLPPSMQNMEVARVLPSELREAGGGGRKARESDLHTVTEILGDDNPNLVQVSVDFLPRSRRGGQIKLRNFLVFCSTGGTPRLGNCLLLLDFKLNKPKLRRTFLPGQH